MWPWDERVYWIGESEDSNIFPDSLPEGLNGVVALTVDDNFFLQFWRLTVIVIK